MRLVVIFVCLIFGLQSQAAPAEQTAPKETQETASVKSEIVKELDSVDFDLADEQFLDSEDVEILTFDEEKKDIIKPADKKVQMSKTKEEKPAVKK